MRRPYGPSPRLRGKPADPPPRQPPQGSIPAPAGETRSVALVMSGTRVHPRACGGNFLLSGVPPSCGGPSPRLRGKHLLATIKRTGKRSIPAPAGETDKLARKRLCRQVHPRACGGNANRLEGVVTDKGPSPRLRGKQVAGQDEKLGMGSIPAPAGETVKWESALINVQVHPRACGGNMARAFCSEGFEGPSPRLRGKLQTKGENHWGDGGRLTTYRPSYSTKFLMGSPSSDTPWRSDVFGAAQVMTTAPWP